MRKLSFILLSVLVLNTFKMSAQNIVTTSNVSGKLIKFPVPNSQYKEVGDAQRYQFASFLPSSNSMLCIYLDTFDITKLVNHENENIKMETYMFVEINKNLIDSDCSDTNFIEVKAEALQLLKDDTIQLLDDANSFLKEIIDEKEDVKLNHLKNLGIIYDTKESCGMLMSFVVKNGNKSTKKLCSVNYLRLNNRLIYVYVYATFTDIAQVKWIKETSESWAKAILGAN
ncbi:MAG: hypothetical protein WCL51_08480 [Bacteroidota bacterium]